MIDSEGFVLATDVAMYARCARMYELARIRKVPPRSTSDTVLAGVLGGIIPDVLGKAISLEEACELAERKLEAELIGVRMPRRITIERLVGYAKLWLSHIHTTFAPVIQPVETRVMARGKVQLPDGETVKIKAPVHIVERTQIGFWRVDGYNRTVAELKYVYAYHLGCMACHAANVYVMVLSRSRGEVVLRRWVMSAGDRAWAADVLAAALDGHKREYYPPCDPESPWCRWFNCRYWHECRKGMEK